MEAFVGILLAAGAIRDPLLPLWAMELIARVLLDVWLFCLGATVGSFLNVVVYRLPRGKNLAFPGSFCPHCGHAIRLWDNIPILSWVALRGWCRDCGGRISPRYLAVEALVATTFLVVLAAEHYLPPLAIVATTRRELSPHDGAPFWGMYGLHLFLVTTIFAAVFIAVDGFRVTRRLYGPALLLGFVLPLVWPQVRSVPAVAAWQGGWQSGLVDGLAGVFVGALVGGVLGAVGRAINESDNEGRADCPCLRCGLVCAMLRMSPGWMGAAVGLVAGWQRAIWLAPIVILISGFAAAGLCRWAIALSTKERPAGEPLETPDITAEITAQTGATPEPEVIEEEIHIVSPPTEPIEPS